MILHSLKITGAGAVVPLSSGSPAIAGYVSPKPLQCKHLQLTTPPTNSASVLVGGSEVTSSVGYPITVGWAGQFLPPVAEVTDWYELSNIFVYVANGDVLYVLYGG